MDLLSVLRQQNHIHIASGGAVMNARIEKLLRDGEGLTVEFKLCRDKLLHTVYETVCSFSNRYGGDILLGVGDDATIQGVAPDAVKQLKKDFANTLNNPQLFNPTLFVELDEIKVDDKVILHCRIPLTSQLVMYRNRAYDRNADGDYDVTHSTDLLWQIAARKKGVSSVEKVYRYTAESDLLLDALIPRVKNMCTMRLANHPWKDMSGMEILKSAGLYRYDQELGYSGFTLAAILLFGREAYGRIIEFITENWCLPKAPGKLDPATFSPQPKNPLIATFFTNINYADTLGSGVRNLYKYTKIYTNGGEPELIEGDMFRTIVPLSLIGASDNAQMSDKTSDNVSDKLKMSDNTTRNKLLEYLRGNGEVTAAEAAKIIGRTPQTARRLLSELAAAGTVIATGANRNRKYRAK
jgi:predicted HTH transcriptional regulator